MTQSICYVKGTIRKDVVAITPKDCRVTEARVLETLYGGGWVPTQLRAVAVVEVPSAATELERLTNLYGAEAIEKAYGHPASARQVIAELLTMSPAKVKASGLLVENDATPVVVLDEDGDAPAPRKPAASKAAPKPAGTKPRKGGSAAASVDSGGDSAQAAQ